MACGTGKTFTALKLAERIAPTAAAAPASCSWCRRSRCSVSRCGSGPPKANWTCGRSRCARTPRWAGCASTEDFNVYDVPIPVTTDPAKLIAEMSHRKRAKGLTVVFSTYQSLPTVADAQALGLDEFDLVICDEAHRTTGVTLAGEDESNFVRVHDNDYLHAARRLYMTATPRIYSDASRTRPTSIPPSWCRWMTNCATARSSTTSRSATPSSTACSPTTRFSCSPWTRR